MKKTTNTKNNQNPEWLLGGNPNAIEEQESEGQNELIASLQLPRKCNSPYGTNTATQYHKMGIKVFTTSKGDDLFLGVKLPDGWKKESTDHSMWNNLVDDKGRIRAKFFYKASFYDRDAFVNFERRIHFRVDRLGFFQGDYSQENGTYKSYNTPYIGRVTDYDETVLFETEPITCEIEYSDYENTRGYSDDYKIKLNLSEKYPDYDDINAYW